MEDLKWELIGVSNPHEWYERMKKEGLYGIKMTTVDLISSPIVEKYHVLCGEVYDHTNIVYLESEINDWLYSIDMNECPLYLIVRSKGNKNG